MGLFGIAMDLQVSFETRGFLRNRLLNEVVQYRKNSVGFDDVIFLYQFET
jgi:hypothetical protein